MTVEDHPSVRSVERVIHAAALPTFSNNPAIRAVNVGGTLALAHALNPAALQRFLFVGTAMAVGPSKERGSLIEESQELGADEDQLVPYTASKAEAERRLRPELPHLPLVIARPSIVVGHTELGVEPSQSIFWVFLVGHMLGAFTCDLADSIDVIPADWCADALLELATRESLAHDLYHVSAGRESSVTIEDLDKVLAHARRVAPMGGSYRKIDKKHIAGIIPEMRGIVPGANHRLFTRAMQLYGGFAELNYVFDSNRLRGEGLSASPPFTSYLGHRTPNPSSYDCSVDPPAPTLSPEQAGGGPRSRMRERRRMHRHACRRGPKPRTLGCQLPAGSSQQPGVPHQSLHRAAHLRGCLRNRPASVDSTVERPSAVVLSIMLLPLNLCS